MWIKTEEERACAYGDRVTAVPMEPAQHRASSALQPALQNPSGSPICQAVGSLPRASKEEGVEISVEGRNSSPGGWVSVQIHVGLGGFLATLTRQRRHVAPCLSGADPRVSVFWKAVPACARTDELKGPCRAPRENQEASFGVLVLFLVFPSDNFTSEIEVSLFQVIVIGKTLLSPSLCW